ncbi:Sorting nexin C terminal [Geosmithia morbida]|uniref:Sorting nexin C terminal n=1 Tax=Geosmithia morbida TaxID=1094350 RepID=A0A9P4Z135_9HYPO|nr:Sorting nexin C terminal [Geosmithia morbida]KAF4125755.1 Sorting nexin C terminal [Geosmithia morbida]
MTSTRVASGTLAPSALPGSLRDARTPLDGTKDAQPPQPLQNGDSEDGGDDRDAAAPGTSIPVFAKSSDDGIPPVAAGDLQSVLLAKLLDFASTATPGTLGAIAVGLSTVLYLLLGPLALLFVGAFGGALGFVAWEASHPEVARIVRGERGLDVLERLRLGAADAEPGKESSPGEDEQTVLRGLDELRPETREALGSLLDAIIRDYVKSWYSPMIPTDHSFPLTCRKILTSYFLSISNHLYRKRPADSFLDLLTNSSSMIIVFMSELASAFADVGPDSDISAVEVICNYRASHPDCHLNNLLNQHQQSVKLRMVSEDLLRFLDRNPNSGDPAWVFLREILANFVLEGALQTCSKADWINSWIIYLLEAGEPDLNQAIDVGMQTGRDVAAASNAAASNKDNASDNNVFIDIDGNVGNIGIAKPDRSGSDARAKAALSHKKKLSKADEEMEVAVEEMKKLNAMIARDEERRRERASTIRKSTDQQAGPRSLHGSLEGLGKSVPPGEPSPTSQLPAAKASPPGSSTDGVSTTSEAIPTPHTPRSVNETTSQGSSPRRSGGTQFTSFDQIQAPPGHGESSGDGQAKKPPLTLHNASFTLHDDNVDKSRIRSKPNWDYLIQVEPSSAMYPGWMIVRRYSDFETLHEILRRIAAVSSATAFTELHKELPAWKVHTRESLRGELERYLRDACWYLALAESEGLKRFLEKSQGHTHGDSKSFGWDTVGKNMLDVLTTAPKGAVEGGRTLVGGVQGVFGNFPGLAKRPTGSSVDLNAAPPSSRLSISTPPRMESKSPVRSDRASIDSQRSSVVSQQPGKMMPMEQRTSYQSQQGDAEGEYFRVGRTERLDSSASGPGSARPSREHSRTSSLAALRSPSSVSLENVKLPPPPDEITEDYDFFRTDTLHKRTGSLATNPENGQQTVAGAAATAAATGPNVTAAATAAAASPVAPAAAAKKPAVKPARQFTQLSEPETRVAVELLFAVINEMYTLSSAWNIRRTLLTAAKSFLLRPGNPSLLTVQNLIQESVLDTYTSDAGIAAQLRRLLKSTMPTDEERASWPSDMTEEERDKLRLKARGLLIRSGVPAALMGVMGQAATSEALGRVFDCLQIEEVARGLIFGLVLQLVRIVTH